MIPACQDLHWIICMWEWQQYKVTHFFLLLINNIHPFPIFSEITGFPLKRSKNQYLRGVQHSFHKPNSWRCGAVNFFFCHFVPLGQFIRMKKGLCYQIVIYLFYSWAIRSNSYFVVQAFLKNKNYLLKVCFIATFNHIPGLVYYNDTIKMHYAIK